MKDWSIYILSSYVHDDIKIKCMTQKLNRDLFAKNVSISNILETNCTTLI